MLADTENYEKEIANKTESELLKEIRSLKRRIGSLKKKVEHPDFEMRGVRPAPDVEIDKLYAYLQIAIGAMGDEYKRSASDRKAQKIQDAMQYLKQVTFSIGGFTNETHTCLLLFKDGTCYKRESTQFLGYIGTVGEPVAEWPAYEVIAELQSLHLGRWKLHYSAMDYGIEIMDGTQWKLAFKFADDTRPLVITGDNAYPYNFCRLLEILEMEEESEELTETE